MQSICRKCLLWNLETKQTAILLSTGMVSLCGVPTHYFLAKRSGAEWLHRQGWSFWCHMCPLLCLSGQESTPRQERYMNWLSMMDSTEKNLSDYGLVDFCSSEYNLILKENQQLVVTTEGRRHTKKKQVAVALRHQHPWVNAIDRKVKTIRAIARGNWLGRVEVTWPCVC